MKQCGSNVKGLAELNQLKRVEQNNCRVENYKEGHGLSEEDESRISKEFGEDANIILAWSDTNKSHQLLPQASSICWDSFLPTRSIKVMLVENDESTRHVVSALLRNCSYEGVYQSFTYFRNNFSTNAYILVFTSEHLLQYISLCNY